MTIPTTLTRMPDRASHNRSDLDALLDEVLVATLSTVVDDQPWTVPMFFARDEDRVLIHGSTGAGLLRILATGTPTTLSVHVLDGIVVAETAFESSANYRSAVLRGTFTPVPEGELEDALRTLTDRLIPGRSNEVPPSTRKELAATQVLQLPITPGSWIYKSRQGPSGMPGQPVEQVWAGVVPVEQIYTTPVADDWVAPDLPPPSSVQRLLATNPRASS